MAAFVLRGIEDMLQTEVKFFSMVRKEGERMYALTLNVTCDSSSSCCTHTVSQTGTSVLASGHCSSLILSLRSRSSSTTRGCNV